MQHLKSFNDLKKLYNFEEEDLSVKKSEEDIVEEPFHQDKKFDPSKDKFSSKTRDLTKSNSLAAAVQPMVQELQALLSDRTNQIENFNKMKIKVMTAINDIKISASPETRRKWSQSVERCRNLIDLSILMTNLVMGAAGLSKAAFVKKGLPF
jgi:hypothetical protein